ncbi:hypothetical protein PSY83_23950, partial [Shigella flexneri]|nr:hypothetical protein [Shigella flexneri]
QQISFAESDLPLIYRTERALQLICDKLQQVELKRVPRVENLLYFMQREKEGLTLSYIKNVIWQAERGLGQETPIESLLTQYH